MVAERRRRWVRDLRVRAAPISGFCRGGALLGYSRDSNKAVTQILRDSNTLWLKGLPVRRFVRTLRGLF
jgi:hypothetical protein